MHQQRPSATKNKVQLKKLWSTCSVAHTRAPASRRLPEGSLEEDGALAAIPPAPSKGAAAYTLDRRALPSLLVGPRSFNKWRHRAHRRCLWRPGPQAQPIHQRASDERCPKAGTESPRSSEAGGRMRAGEKTPRLCVHSRSRRTRRKCPQRELL